MCFILNKPSFIYYSDFFKFIKFECLKHFSLLCMSLSLVIRVIYIFENVELYNKSKYQCVDMDFLGELNK